MFEKNENEQKRDGGWPFFVNVVWKIIKTYKKEAQVLTLCTPGIAIGMMPEMSYRGGHCVIEPGDRLHLVSDGTFEVETAPGEMLSFNDFVERLSRADSPGEVLEWVRSLNGSGPLPDDFSLLTIDF